MPEATIEFPHSELKQHRILIGTPVLSTCEVVYTQSMVRTVRWFTAQSVHLDVLFLYGHSVHTARNKITAAFMAGEYTHLMFIDADHGWTPENILKLLYMDKEVIGVVARKKKQEVEWAANLPKGDTFIDAKGAMDWTDGDLGTGFLMIKRSAFEKMFNAYPEFKLKHPEIPIVTDAPPGTEDNYYSLFEFMIEDGVEYGEDITFCRRWKSLGEKLWVDPYGSISHYGSCDFKGCVSDAFTPTEEYIVSSCAGSAALV